MSLPIISTVRVRSCVARWRCAGWEPPVLNLSCLSKTVYVQCCQLLAGLLLCVVLTGCRTVEFRNRLIEAEMPAHTSIPSELNKTSLPPYIIEPPDILLIDAVKVVPKAPYRIETLDVLQVLVEGAFEEQPIFGLYRVESGGTINLGPVYGTVNVLGQTLEEATQSVTDHLRTVLREPQVSISLAEAAGKQQIAGEHLVTPDGMVNLGTYGGVYLAGLTLPQARAAIESHLSAYLEQPEVSIDVFAYNSKVYYIVTEGAGLGEQVVRLPVTGNETVLDAISQIQGLSRVSSKTIWIARPAPDGVGCDQILPVNWKDITRGASTATNYQLMPGDRVFIAEDKMIAFESFVSKMVGPFERAFGFTLLGTQTIQTINRSPDGLGPRGTTNPFFF